MPATARRGIAIRLKDNECRDENGRIKKDVAETIGPALQNSIINTWTKECQPGRRPYVTFRLEPSRLMVDLQYEICTDVQSAEFRALEFDGMGFRQNVAQGIAASLMSWGKREYDVCFRSDDRNCLQLVD